MIRMTAFRKGLFIERFGGRCSENVTVFRIAVRLRSLWSVKKRIRCFQAWWRSPSIANGFWCSRQAFVIRGQRDRHFNHCCKLLKCYRKTNHPGYYNLNIDPLPLLYPFSHVPIGCTGHASTNFCCAPARSCTKRGTAYPGNLCRKSFTSRMPCSTGTSKWAAPVTRSSWCR